MPETSYGGEHLHGNVFEMAAAHLFHLARNHPFVEGVAAGRVGKAEVAVFLREHSVSR